MRLSPKDRFFLVIKYICLVFFTVLCLYPLLWLLLSSFKTNTELYANPWGLPESFSFANYIQAIEEGHILQYFGNSVIIAVSAVFVSVLLSSMVSINREIILCVLIFEICTFAHKILSFQKSYIRNVIKGET